MTTFEIAGKYKKLYEIINSSNIDPETGEVLYEIDEALEYELKQLDDTRDKKLESIEYLKREFKKSEEALKEEAKRLTDRAKSFTNKIEELKKLQDILLDGEKLKTDKFTFYYKNTKSVVVDINTTPSEYKKVEYKALKAEISKALKAGKEVAGAKFVENTSLVVK